MKTQTSKKYDLSYAQKALWFIQNLDLSSGTYNISALLKSGDLINTELLKMALLQIISEQELLRSSYSLGEDGQPFRWVREGNSSSLNYSISKEFKSFKDAKKSIAEESKISFDLEKDPPLRVKVFLHDDGHSIHVCFHHINSDASSRKLFVNRLQQIYYSLVGEKHSMMIPSQDYALYVKKETEFLKNQGSEELDYWSGKLAGEIPNLNMPCDFPRPKIQTYQGGTVYLNIDESLSQKIFEIAKQESSTPFAVLFAIFRIFLGIYTGQDDLIIGSSVKNNEDFENTFGYFINKISLRAPCDFELSFNDFLAEATETVLEGLANGSYPFPLLVEKLRVARDPSRSPIFQANLAYQIIEESDIETNVSAMGYGINEAQSPRWEMKRIEHSEGQFDIALRAKQQGSLLSISLQYNNSLFLHATAETMAAVFEELVQQIAINPKAQIKSFEIVPTKQKKLILNSFNATEFIGSPDLAAVDLFEKCVAKFPKNNAVVFQNEKLTYSELNEQAESIAAHLQRNGLKKGDIVALLIEPSLDTILSMISVLKAGGAYLPIDASLPADRVEYILKDSRAPFLLVSVSQQTDMQYEGKIIDLRNKSIIQVPSKDFIRAATRPDDLLYVIYTSGTTGNPKGTMLENRCLVNYVTWFQKRYEIVAAHKAALLTSYAYDLGYTTLWTTILSGGELHILPDDLCKDSSSLLDYFDTRFISFIKLTPSFLNALVSSREIEESKGFIHIRIIVTGGERIKTDDISKIYSIFPNIRVINHYGPTETTIGVMTFPVDRNGIDEFALHPVIGRPIGNVKAYVVNKFMKLLPVGVPGELLISGVSVGRGYLYRNELTKEKFITNPFHPEYRIYKSGDLAKWQADGTIEFLGRIDRQVKIRGYRVELGEIEQQIINSGEVEKAVVIENCKNEANRFLCAYIVSDNTVDIENLKKKISRTLPDYMIPTKFIQIPDIPMTPNGKLDANALPDSDQSDGKANDSVEGPKNNIEVQLLNLWSKILGTDPAHIGVTQNFFELGGHSLLVIRLLGEINKLFKVRVPIPVFYSVGTIRGLSYHISGATSAEHPQKVQMLLQDMLNDRSAAITTNQLLQECNLEDEIRSLKPITGELNPNSVHIFLTGGTGFLGAHVVYDLLKNTKANVTCLVRAKENIGAHKRMLEAFDKYKLPVDLDLQKNMKVLAGDFSLPEFGLDPIAYAKLADEADCVFHLGAWVNHIFSYSDLKAANVGGTKEVLRFACRKRTKKVIFASTLSIGVKKESASLDHGKPLYLGYNQTKWVAEKLVQMAQARGIPTVVFRPGIMTWSATTGASNLTQFECLFLKSCIESGFFPEVEVAAKLVPYLTPIDFAAEAVRKIAFSKDYNGSAFHLRNSARSNWKILFEQFNKFGFLMESVKYDDWVKAVSEVTESHVSGGAASLGLALTKARMSRRDLRAKDEAIIESESLSSQEYVSDDTMKVLGGLSSSPENPNSVNKWLNYMIEQGFLPSPATKSRTAKRSGR